MKKIRGRHSKINMEVVNKRKYVEIEGKKGLQYVPPRKHRFYQLQAEWAIASRDGKQAIAELLLDNPNWKIGISNGELIQLP